ncbi:hypothetical protein BDC45DRAFT_518415 [Circinella umbellata]|nr:hypothetical protein BDC45DRAFT_518415 [Circinella umbellata]
MYIQLLLYFFFLISRDTHGSKLTTRVFILYYRVSYELNIWGVLTKALPGFFNLVVFLMDPAFIGALRLLKR